MKDRLSAFWSRRSGKSKLIMLALAFLLVFFSACCVFGLLLPRSPESENEAESQPVSQVVSDATTMPAPTSTTAPTAEPEPSITATASSTPLPQARVDLALDPPVLVDEVLQIRGTGSLPDGALLIYEVRHEALATSAFDANQLFIEGVLTVESGTFSADLDLGDWPGGSIEVWVAFETVITSEITQPDEVIATYGPMGEYMVGPQVVTLGPLKRAEEIASVFKPYKPISLSGVGQSATDPIDLATGVYIFEFTHDGRSNFIVYVFQDGQSDLLINEIGAYRGARPVAGGRPVILDIDADGQWSVQIRPIGQQDTAAFSGQGDAVSELFIPPAAGAWEIKHTGRSNFIVILHCANGSDLVQNEIGAVDGSRMIRFGRDICFWEVEADGQWSLLPR